MESTLHRVEKALWRKLCSIPEEDHFFCGCGCLHVPAHGLRTTCDCECSWASHMLGRCPADTDDLIAAWDAAPAAWDPEWRNAPQWPKIHKLWLPQFTGQCHNCGFHGDAPADAQGDAQADPQNSSGNSSTASAAGIPLWNPSAEPGGAGPPPQAQQ